MSSITNASIKPRTRVVRADAGRWGLDLRVLTQTQVREPRPATGGVEGALGFCVQNGGFLCTAVSIRISKYRANISKYHMYIILYQELHDTGDTDVWA